MSIKDVEAKIKQQELLKKIEEALKPIVNRPARTAGETAKELQAYYQSVFNAIYGNGAVTITVEVSEDGQVEVTGQYNQSLETLSMEVKI